MSAMLDFFFFFLYTPYFWDLLLFLWPFGILSISSILWKMDLIQRETIPTWSCRMCFCTVTAWVFNPVGSFPMLPQVLCTALVCTRGSVELSQSCVGCCADGEGCLQRMLPPKTKCLCLPSNCFHTTNSFKALSTRISSEGSLWYPVLLAS